MFLIPGMKLDDAVLRAYAALDLDGVTDEVTRKVKAENQEMMKPEYWWIDSMVESITFGNHNTRDDQTLTVNWICGKKTTVETKIGRFERFKAIRWRSFSRRRASARTTPPCFCSLISPHLSLRPAGVQPADGGGQEQGHRGTAGDTHLAGERFSEKAEGEEVDLMEDNGG